MSYREEMKDSLKLIRRCCADSLKRYRRSAKLYGKYDYRTTLELGVYQGMKGSIRIMEHEIKYLMLSNQKIVDTDY